MIASLALQKAIRAALVAHAPLTAIVPAEAIVDAHGVPARFPSILLGESTEEPNQIGYESSIVEARADLHIWTQETDLAGAKVIAGEVHDAFAAIGNPTGFRFIWRKITATRFLRDPSGKHSHAVISLAAYLEPTP